MILSDLQPLANHLWQSTLFATVAGLLTLTLRQNRAQTRYWLWLAASLKFLIPFSVLVMAGSLFERRVEAPVVSGFAFAIEQASRPFAITVPVATTPATGPSFASLIPSILSAVWAIGFAILLFSRWSRWREIRAALRTATPIDLPIGVEVMSSPQFFEPGVFGVLRPVLLLPARISSHLTPAQLEAVLRHELCHIRRRDNLAAAIHMVVEAVFWFHPLVWWLGARLMQERENACDEEVLRMGSEPEAYAEGIVRICELYVASPLPCVAGVTGANLKKRIEAIMNNRPALELNFVKRAGLAMAGIVAVAIPVILGVTNAPLLRAQAESNLRFEVASVKRVDIPTTIDGRVRVFPPTGGIGTSDPSRISYPGAQLMVLISQAFGVRGDQITGAPEWLGKERYEIVANIPDGATKAQFNVMMGNLLRDRFHLRFHMDSKVLPVYALRVAKNGPKLRETARRDGDATVPSRPIGERDAQGFIMVPPGFTGAVSIPLPGEIFMTAQDVPIASLVGMIESPASGAGRPITDETGLTGHYDYKIHFAYGRPVPAGAASDPAPSIFTAVQEQLGLKLESSTSSFPQLIIDSMDREPTEN